MFLFVICFRGSDPCLSWWHIMTPLRRLIGEEQFNFATLCVGILCVCLGWWFGILHVASGSCSKLGHQFQVVEFCWKATSYTIHRATWYCCSTMFLTPDQVQPQLPGCVALTYITDPTIEKLVVLSVFSRNPLCCLIKKLVGLVVLLCSGRRISLSQLRSILERPVENLVGDR